MKLELSELQKSITTAYPDLETIRKRSAFYSDMHILAAIFGVLIIISFSVVLSIIHSGGFIIFLGFFVIIGYAYIIHSLTIKRLDYKIYFDSIKSDYMKTVLKQIDESFDYCDGTIPLEDVINSGLFEKRYVTAEKLQGEDYFKGNYKGVQVQISEIYFGVGENIRADGNFDTSVLVIANFNKCLKSETYVYDRGFIESEEKTYVLSSPKGNALILENNDFESKFISSSRDEIEGRYILSLSFMERMLELKKGLSRNNIYMSFRNNKVSLLIYNKLLFEPNLFRSIKDDKTFVRFYNETRAILKVIDVLRLNDIIWKDNLSVTKS